MGVGSAGAVGQPPMVNSKTPVEAPMTGVIWEGGEGGGHNTAITYQTLMDQP